MIWYFRVCGTYKPTHLQYTVCIVQCSMQRIYTWGCMHSKELFKTFTDTISYTLHIFHAKHKRFGNRSSEIKWFEMWNSNVFTMSWAKGIPIYYYILIGYANEFLMFNSIPFGFESLFRFHKHPSISIRFE